MRLSERSSKMLRETVEDKKLLVVELAKVCSTKQEFLETVMHEFGQDKDFNEIYDTIKKTATNLYDKYAPKEIKDFVSKAAPSYQQSYEKYSDPKNIDEMERGVKEFASQLGEGLKNANAIFNMVGKPIGIGTKDLPFILSIIIAGSTGGIGAIPYALVQYFVRKQIYGGAGKLYDKVVGTQQNPAMENILSNKYLKRLWEANEYRDDLRRKTAERVGSVAGAISGNAKIAMTAIKKYMPQLVKLANENKVAIGKTIFLYGIGVLMGMGAAKIHDLASGKPQQDALDGLKMMGWNDKEIAEFKEMLRLVDKITSPNWEPNQEDNDRLAYLNRNQELAGIRTNIDHDDPNMRMAAYAASQGDMEKAHFYQQQAAEENMKKFMDGKFSDVKGPLTYSGPKFSPEQSAKFLQNQPTPEQIDAAVPVPSIYRAAERGSEELKKIGDAFTDYITPKRSLDSILGDFETNQDIADRIEKTLSRSGK